jgi:undecaprenyl-diphosphatase
MTWWQALILGVVEGLSEYLPISSTGHLIVVQRLLGVGVGGAEAKAAADAYAICIQAGAIVAVLGLYWRHVKQMLMGLIGRDPRGLRLAINIMAGFVPAAVIGLLANKWIKENLFGGDRYGLWPIIIAWFVGGVAILVVALRRRRSPQAVALSEGDQRPGFDLYELTWQAALVIGFAQCIAMWPGVSRSLVTIVGGVLVGMRLAAAVEFSFLLGVVTLSAATAYDGLKHGRVMVDQYGPVVLLVGFLFAFLSAVIAVKWMVAYLNKHGLEVFGYYRVAIALFVALMVLFGVFVG